MGHDLRRALQRQFTGGGDHVQSKEFDEECELANNKVRRVLVFTATSQAGAGNVKVRGANSVKLAKSSR